MHYTLTVYQSDDTTPLFEVGTSASHSHPYLHVPGEMDLGEVDLLAGKAMIGQVNLRVIDPQTGPDQAERWMTARLGIPAGQEGAGHSALNGRRAELRRSDGRLVMDGVVWGVQLSDSAAGFHLQLRDIRERARKLPLFRRTGTASVLPRGVIDGYGRLPGGGWLIPPTRPLRADVVSSGIAGIMLDFLAHHWQRKDKKWWAIPDLVLTDDIRSAVQTEVTQGPDFGFGAGPSYRCPLVTVLWRYVGDTTWQELRAPIPASSVIGGAPLLSTQTAHLPATADRESMVVEAIRGIRLSSILQAPLPVTGMGPVEVILRYDGPPTEAYPYHYEGPAGELLRDVLRGDYSSSDGPSKLRYDEAAVLALTTPVRVRLTKPVDDARPWLEQAHQQLAAAPALDSQGRISPVLAELPPTDAPLPVITEQNATAIPGWEHPADGAVTSVAVRYQRDYLVRAIDDPLGERSAGDGIASIDVTVEHAGPEWARDLMGDHPLEIDGWLYRAIGGAEGDPVTGDVIDEAGAQASRRLGYLFIDRWLFGGQTSFVRVKEGDFPGLREGSWVIDERPWRPNYREGRRGGSTLAQVVSIRAAAPGWLDLRLVDAGPLDQPLTTPAIGPLAATDTGGVRIPVTSVPTGAEVAVYYAISSAEPPEGSGLWTWAGRVAEPGAVETPPVPHGARVWAYARSEAPGRRPSVRTARRSITLPATPGVYGVRAGIDSEGAATVQWEGNPHTAGVRIYYAVYDVADDPPDPLVTFIDREASALSATLPIPVGATQVLSVEIEPWSGWTGSAVSGEAGDRVPVSVAANRPPPVELPPIPEYAECRARIVWAESDREHYVVQVTSVPAGQVYLYSLQGATIVSGPGLGVPAPSGQKWKLQRPAARSADGEAVWRTDPPGYVQDDDAVVIPAIGRDTVPLTLRVRQIAQTATTRTVRVSVGDPHYAESSDPVTISYVQQGTGGVTPVSGQQIPASAIRDTPAATEAQPNGYVDFVITRPPEGSGDGRVIFTATRPGRVQDSDPVDVAELPPEVPVEALPPTVRAVVESLTGVSAEIRVTGSDWQGGTSGLQWSWRWHTLGDPLPAWGSWQSLPAAGALQQLARHAGRDRQAYFRVMDSAGRISSDAVVRAPAQYQAIDPDTGRIDRGTPTSDGRLLEDQDSSQLRADQAEAGAINEMHDRGLKPDGFDGNVGTGASARPAVQVVDGVDRSLGALTENSRLRTGVEADADIAGLLDAGEVAAQVQEPSQNLLPVDERPGQEATRSGTGIQSGRNIPIEELGLVPGQPYSLTLDCRAEGGAQARARIRWQTPGGNIYHTGPPISDSSYTRTAVATGGNTVPAGATHFRREWENLTGTGTAYFRRWMLNHGPVGLGFDEPGWRPGRERHLPAGTGIYDTVSIPREVARGIRQGEARHGDPIGLVPAFQETPAFIASPGGITFHPDLATHAHGPVIDFLQPSPSGALFYAMLRATAGTPVERSAVFGPGGSGDPSWVATKTQSAEAYDQRYTFVVSTSPIFPGEILRVGYWYHSGTAWILAGVRTFSAQATNDERTFALSEMGAGSMFGLTVEEGVGTLSGRVKWGEATVPGEKEATTDDLPIPYTVIGGT